MFSFIDCCFAASLRPEKSFPKITLFYSTAPTKKQMAEKLVKYDKTGPPRSYLFCHMSTCSRALFCTFLTSNFYRYTDLFLKLDLKYGFEIWTSSANMDQSVLLFPSLTNPHQLPSSFRDEFQSSAEPIIAKTSNGTVVEFQNDYALQDLIKRFTVDDLGKSSNVEEEDSSDISDCDEVTNQNLVSPSLTTSDVLMLAFTILSEYGQSSLLVEYISSCFESTKTDSDLRSGIISCSDFDENEFIDFCRTETDICLDKLWILGSIVLLLKSTKFTSTLLELKEKFIMDYQHILQQKNNGNLFLDESLINLPLLHCLAD